MSLFDKQFVSTNLWSSNYFNHIISYNQISINQDIIGAVDGVFANFLTNHIINYNLFDKDITVVDNINFIFETVNRQTA